MGVRGFFTTENTETTEEGKQRHARKRPTRATRVGGFSRQKRTNFPMIQKSLITNIPARSASEGKGVIRLDQLCARVGTNFFPRFTFGRESAPCERLF